MTRSLVAAVAGVPLVPEEDQHDGPTSARTGSMIARPAATHRARPWMQSVLAGCCAQELWCGTASAGHRARYRAQASLSAAAWLAFVLAAAVAAVAAPDRCSNCAYRVLADEQTVLLPLPGPVSPPPVVMCASVCHSCVHTASSRRAQRALTAGCRELCTACGTTTTHRASAPRPAGTPLHAGIIVRLLPLCFSFSFLSFCLAVR